VFSNLSSDAFKANAAQWEKGVRDALRLVPKVTTALVFSETPKALESVPLCLIRNLEHSERCDQSWPDAINDQLRRIATDEGAVFIDLRPIFCTASRCPVITEDTLIYADGDHLTIPYSRARAEWLVDTLRPVLAKHGLR